MKKRINGITARQGFLLLSLSFCLFLFIGVFFVEKQGNKDIAFLVEQNAALIGGMINGREASDLPIFKDEIHEDDLQAGRSFIEGKGYLDLPSKAYPAYYEIVQKKS